MKVLVFGATGMVGGDVLTHCLGDSRIDRVVSVGRRATGLKHDRLTEIEHRDYLNYASIKSELVDADLCLFCIGVYQTQVPKEMFWEVTVGYLSALVSSFEEVNRGVRFCLFSAQGARQDEKTPILFGKAKGRAERVLFESRLGEAYAFRPGFINPSDGSQMAGFSFAAFRLIYRLFPRVGIDSGDLAKVMVDVGIDGSDLTIFENRDLRSYVPGGSH